MVHIELQQLSQSLAIPSHSQYQHWANQALANSQHNHERKYELSLRIVDEDEMCNLNQRYRNKRGATNVLSFTSNLPQEIIAQLEIHLLGDVIICAPIVEQEAHQQRKSTEDHWAHMLIHGTLHLLGYDHMDAQEADTMEAIEIRTLEQLGINNPYITAH